MEAEFRVIYDKAKNFTMTSQERMYALYQAVKYVPKPRCRVILWNAECGRAAGSMLMAYTLLELKSRQEIYLYDTFTRMPKPTVKDRR